MGPEAAVHQTHPPARHGPRAYFLRRGGQRTTAGTRPQRAVRDELAADGHEWVVITDITGRDYEPGEFDSLFVNPGS